MASDGPNGSELSRRTTTLITPNKSAGTTLRKNATTTGCQPRNAPAIIIRSASPKPRASLPSPMLNRKPTVRSIKVPTSMPASPVASPVSQLPPGASQPGSGPQTGQGSKPALSPSSQYDPSDNPTQTSRSGHVLT